jgi:hypothetical protein
MGERIASGVPLGEEVVEYFGTMPLGYQQSLHNAAITVRRNATPAFVEQFDAPMVVAIPIDAEREQPAYITRTLRQYANQVDPPPYRVVLFANYDEEDGDYRPVRKARNAIARFLAENPHVPVSYFEAERPEDATIGGIRKLVSDVAIMPFVASKSPKDALLINHDIDTHSLHPLYLRRMWEAFNRPDRLTTTINSEVRHARSLEWGRARQPNMDMVNAWQDFSVMASGRYYDLGNGVSVRGYCAARGYNPQRLQAETFDVIGRIHEGYTARHRGIYRVPGAYLYTSPRRLNTKQFYTAGEIQEFWVPGDMTEPSSTDYRDGPVFTLPDILPVWRDWYIRSFTRGLVTAMAFHIRYQHPEHNRSEALARARRRMRMAHVAIGGPEDLTTAA